jgi:hypothetical protein
MPGPIVHNETTASELGDFVAILSNLTRRAFGIEEPPEYVVYQEHTSDAIHHFWATVHIYGRGTASERPYRFTGRTTSDETQAIQLAAREAVVHLRHRSPRVNIRPFYYYPSREGYGSPTQVANGDHESDPALVHLVRYLRAQEALFDQVTLDLIATRRTLALLTPVRSEAAPAVDTPIVLFGRPVEPPSSAPVIYPGNAFASPEELRRLLEPYSNGTVASTPREGHHHYTSPAAPHPTPASSDAEAHGEASTSTRRARLDVNEVD